MIVSFNFYYARDGAADAVLRQRLHASDVRVGLGLPYGRVMRRVAGDAALPDVIWEQVFDNVGGHETDMAARAASPEFEAVRAGMRPLCRRFERPLFEVQGSLSAQAAPAADPKLVALLWVFSASGNAPAIVSALERLAGAGSRVLRLITPGADLPAVIWQRAHTGAALAPALQTAVQGLASDVRESAWAVQ